ncbi:MAG TPA: CoA-binding protein [Pseudonocardiaceae bacterium]|jgi:predicted CoA-binding protein|nr:CoA-binding protein [Pseudonocardiaceae bacterium]
MATEVEQILAGVGSVLLVDWPSRDVPDTLAGAGYAVFVKGGPEPDNYAAHEMSDGQVVVRQVGRPPEHVDLVYSHRPLGELPGIVATAVELGAGAVWWQSGMTGADVKDPKGCWVEEDASRAAREIVESAGLEYVDDVYLADAVRLLGGR